jgi:hypothetical protein
MPSMRRPSCRISPAEGGTIPATMLSNVDFPQPEGPTKATNSPLAISRSTGASATVSLPRAT